MERWHHALAAKLLIHPVDGTRISPAAELEIAFGRARAAAAFVLELARAHRLAATGNASGDAVWVQLGHGRVRFTLNRREAVVVVRSLEGESRLHWDERVGGLVDVTGTPHDLDAIARKAIDDLVAAWNLYPAQRLSSAPPPEPDDEPTKG